MEIRARVYPDRLPSEQRQERGWEPFSAWQVCSLDEHWDQRNAATQCRFQFESNEVILSLETRGKPSCPEDCYADVALLKGDLEMFHEVDTRWNAVDVSIHIRVAKRGAQVVVDSTRDRFRVVSTIIDKNGHDEPLLSGQVVLRPLPVGNVGTVKKP